MFENIIKAGDGNSFLINRIIEIEYNLFNKVNNIGARATCQDDSETFYIMRYSQHLACSMQTLNSYMNDLNTASGQGRNIVAEKYAYIMEETDLDYFKEHLAGELPYITVEKINLINCILQHLNKQHFAFTKKYPLYSMKCRPYDKIAGNVISFVAYIKGELKTYSTNTLEFLLKDIISYEDNKENYIEFIQNETCRFMGLQV